MKGLVGKIILSAFSVGLLLPAVQACSDTEGSESMQTEEVRAVSIQVKEIKSRQYTDYIPLIGVIQAVNKTSLSASEAARIGSIVQDKGSYVGKGDTILVMDNDVLKASLDAAEAQYKLDDITFEKQEIIYKENINSEYEFLQSKYRRDQSKANYELIKARYDRTFLIAPFNCVVDRRYYEIGEFVGPGIPILDLVSRDKFKVETGVPERYVGKIKKGDKARIKLKSVDAEELTGTVTYVGTSISTDNRTYPIEVVLDGNSEYLKPELAAEVYVRNGQYKNIFMIPEDVVMRLDDGYVVFVDENGIAKSKAVSILNRTGDNVAIQSGLSDGDNLIVVGYQNLIDGQRVKIVN